jgi:hypothetical protein
MRRLAAIFFSLALAACSRSVTKGDLPGVYVAKEGDITQELRLEQNGTYVNTLYINGSVQWSENQSWIYEVHDGKSGTVFSKFRFGLKDTPSSAGYWFVEPVKSAAGGIQLCYDPDLGRCFQMK